MITEQRCGGGGGGGMIYVNKAVFVPRVHQNTT